MGSYKSLREIRELLGGYVETDFINYPPNHGWIINQYLLHDSEWLLTSSSDRMTLYHALISVADFDYYIPYELYEYCVSEGHVWTENKHIVYDSPLGPGTDIKFPQNDISVSNSLELECISFIRELAKTGNANSLEDIRHLLENLCRHDK
jgi:hypothetical protein